MKKIINLIVMLGAAVGFTACSLDLEPPTAIAGDKAAQAKYIIGLRNGIYSNITTLTGYGFTGIMYADYYTDLFNETTNSGNRGGFYSRWELYSNDQDNQTIWASYYTQILQINYAIGKAQEVIAKDASAAEEMNFYIGEFSFFRAYLMHQLALRFCQDYDKDNAANQLGLPYPKTYEPGAQLNRGTLAQTYADILADIATAEQYVTTQGAQNAKYLTVDAITAFKAQVALQMHEYGDAITYASSLYTKYPLAQTKDDVDNMWKHDTSTETIFQCDVTKTTVGVLTQTTDYTNGSWQTNDEYFSYSPGYVPEQWVCNLYADEDFRYGTYVGPASIRNIANGWLMVKLLGNEDLRTSATVLNYYNMPKVFRVAEMYLIEAEAQYRNSGDALTPLNALREARGLAELPAGTTGENLFTEIKNECAREFIGEGRRLFDLKRWGDGFTRDGQTACTAILQGGTSTYQMTREASDLKFVWPIPQYEMQNNPNFGSQNDGYTE